MNRSALYMYKLPFDAEEVVYTDKLTFVTSGTNDGESAKLTIMANQMLETGGEGNQVCTSAVVVLVDSNYSVDKFSM